MTDTLMKLALTDDHPVMLQGIANLINAQGDMEVIGSYSCGEDLLNALPQQQPDLLLLDINLPDISGNTLVRQIHKAYPAMKIIALTSLDTPFQVKDMMQHGCSGYILKTSSPDVIVRAIHEVFNGGEFIESSLKENLLQHTLKKSMDTQLTKREKEILRLICAGSTNQIIAKQLFLSIRTIENHRFSLYQKFQVKNTAALVKIALEKGLID